jgi:hypothetical protein
LEQGKSQWEGVLGTVTQAGDSGFISRKGRKVRKGLLFEKPILRTTEVTENPIHPQQRSTFLHLFLKFSIWLRECTSLARIDESRLDVVCMLKEDLLLEQQPFAKLCGLCGK